MAYVLVTIVSHAVHVLMSVHQAQSLRARSILSTQMFAQSVVLVQMFALTRQSVFLNR